MNLQNILVAIISLLFITLAVDKFLPFMEPPCTLMDSIDPNIWKMLGVTTFVGGILIWIPKFRKYVAGFFIVYMLFFTGIHLASNTYDVGGAVFTAAILGLLFWNPSFLGDKNKLNLQK